MLFKFVYNNFILLVWGFVFFLIDRWKFGEEVGGLFEWNQKCLGEYDCWFIDVVVLE